LKENAEFKEVIDYGTFDTDIAKRKILRFIVDDGIKTRPHRKILFDAAFYAYGGFTGRWGTAWMTTIDLAKPAHPYILKASKTTYAE